MAPLGAVVVRIDLRAELDLLDDGLCLVLARLPGLQRRLILELAEVHELADRRPRGRGDLHEVEVRLLGQPERIVDRDYPDLLAGRADKTYFGYADALVDARFDADVTSCVTLSLPGPFPVQDLLWCLPLICRRPRTPACGATMSTAPRRPACAGPVAPRKRRRPTRLRAPARCVRPGQSACGLTGLPSSLTAVRLRTRQR
jgi:hypothetical protein